MPCPRHRTPLRPARALPALAAVLPLLGCLGLDAATWAGPKVDPQRAALAADKLVDVPTTFQWQAGFSAAILDLLGARIDPAEHDWLQAHYGLAEATAQGRATRLAFCDAPSQAERPIREWDSAFAALQACDLAAGWTTPEQLRTRAGSPEDAVVAAWVFRELTDGGIAAADATRIASVLAGLERSCTPPTLGWTTAGATTVPTVGLSRDDTCAALVPLALDASGADVTRLPQALPEGAARVLGVAAPPETPVKTVRTQVQQATKRHDAVGTRALAATQEPATVSTPVVAIDVLFSDPTPPEPDRPFWQLDVGPDGQVTVRASPGKEKLGPFGIDALGQWLAQPEQASVEPWDVDIQVDVPGDLAWGKVLPVIATLKAADKDHRLVVQP